MQQTLQTNHDKEYANGFHKMDLIEVSIISRVRTAQKVNSTRPAYGLNMYALVNAP